MSHHKDGHGGGQHEAAGGYDRALREPADAADAVARGASAAQPRAEADQQACKGHQARIDLNGNAQPTGRQQIRCAASEHPDQEARAPGRLALRGRQQTADNAGDARDAAVNPKQQDGRQADQQTAEQAGPRREVCDCFHGETKLQFEVYSIHTPLGM